MAKIRKEIEIMKKVRHPHCVQFYSVYESANNIYIVMELMAGGELLKRLVEKEKYTEMEAARVFHQICKAVKYLHSIGIVHRDLKPENILYATNDPDSPIKIADYGLSKLVDSAALSSGRARIYSRCGTVNFVAPEVYEGKAYGTGCDVWSAGVILYILLCGFLPFEQTECETSSGEESVMVPQFGKLDFPMPYWRDISKEACNLCSKMLDVNPDTRISMGKVLAHDWIKMFLSGQLPDRHMPMIQTQLQDLRARKLMGAVHSLTALQRMRSTVDLRALHHVIRGEAETRLAHLKLQPEREAELRESFDLLDRDRSGRISLKNLSDAMHAFGLRTGEDELSDMMERFDLFQTGDITFDEFCIMMSVPHHPLPSILDEGSPSNSDHNLPPDESPPSHELLPRGSDLSEELRATFDALDVDGSGFVDAANVREVLKRFGVELSEEEAAAMVGTADLKGNGVIDFDEFWALMSRVQEQHGQAFA